MSIDFRKVTPQDIEKLSAILEKGGIVTDQELRINYSHDEFIKEDSQYLPDVVVKPATTRQVSDILQFAYEQGIPVTPRGGGTGLCGGCVPIFGGIVLSLENMCKGIDIDKENLMATAEAGVPLSDFYEAVETEGLFFPPHPGDESATIGGVIATNAGGARAVKYGVIRNFVRGLEAVLPDGEILQVGGKLFKNSTGYSLLNLLIGSEGTLAIVTKATIHLVPPPAITYTLIASYETLADAIQTAPVILQNKVVPMALEFIPRDAIPVTEEHLNKKWPAKKGSADLMIILDGTTEDEILNLSEKVGQICMNHSALEVIVADSPSKQSHILEIRSQIYSAFKDHLIELLDISIPRASIPDFVNESMEIAAEAGLWVSTYGHAADGNVHSHIMKSTWNNGAWTEVSGWEEKYPRVRNSIHALGKTLGGTVSGEHGIGFAKKQYVPGFVGPRQVQLMKMIKNAFDPKGILNPGKIF